MIKKIRLILVSLFIITITVIFTSIKINKVSAANQTAVDKLKADIESGEYAKKVFDQIKNVIPEFDIPYAEFEERVNGNSQYRILEITPRVYINDSSEISDMQNSMNYLKDLFDTIVRQNPQYANIPLVANMSKFTLDTMTVKEFVSNREELEGLYDAVVFTSGLYTAENVTACDFTLENRTTYFVTIYDNKGVRVYEGNSTVKTDKINSVNKHGFGEEYYSNGKKKYKGLFRNNQYHDANAVLYDENGNIKYEGGFKDGKRSCYGISYKNGLVEYIGQWSNDKYHGYGILYNGHDIEYVGYFNNGQKASSSYTNRYLDDITIYKAEELIERFVKKGIPVFIHEDALDDKGNNIYNKLNPLINQYNNLYRYNYEENNSNNNMNTDIVSAIMHITMLQSERPNFQVISKPVEYKDNRNNTLTNSDVYREDDYLNFTINLTNKDSAIMNFYLDINQNGKFDEVDLVFSRSISRGTTSFSYKLPLLYSGQVQYKIEVISGNSKSIYINSFRYHSGDTKTIKILYVIEDDNKYQTNLQNALNNILRDAGLNKVNEYAVQIKVCTLKEFKKNNPKNHECAHEAVMNDADVVLLGREIFDNVIHKHALESIEVQITVHQKPVIFTSSVTLGDNHWMDYFYDDLSLSTVQTSNYKLLDRVDRLEIINQNPYVMYPYNMNNEDLQIPKGLNYALNEKYQLNLENPNLVNLINMYNSKDKNYDRFDSYNNYYYMKIKNVIYLNVGYDKYNNFTNVEQKLLVDAIVNGFIEYKSKDRNNIEFLNIALENRDHENALIDVKDGGVSFTFTPLSNIQEDVHYTLKVGKDTIENGSLSLGESKTIHLNDLPRPTNNTIDVVNVFLTVSNSKITETYSFNIYIADLETYGVTLESNLLINAVTSGTNKYIQVNKRYSNQYNVKFGSIDVSNVSGNLPTTLTLRNMKLTQSIPQGIIITNSPYKDKVVDNVLTIDLGNITYQLVDDMYVPVSSNNKTFTVEFEANNPGSMSFGAPILTFNGIGSDTAALTNTSANFTALYSIEGRVSPVFNKFLFIPFGESRNLADMFSFGEHTLIKQISFTSHDSNFVLTDGKYIRASEVGTGEFSIEVIDIFGNRVDRTFDILSYVPITVLNIPTISLYVGEDYALQLPEHYRNILYKYISGNPDIVEITGNNNFYMIHGLQQGYAEYKFYGYDIDGNVIETYVTIIVDEQWDIKFTQKELVLFIGETFNLDSIIELNNGYTLNDVVIKAINNKEIIAIYPERTIEALNIGKVIIQANLPNDSTAQLVVKVYDRISNESGFVTEFKNNTVKFYQGFNINLTKYLVILPDVIDINDLRIEFEIVEMSDPNLAELMGHTLITNKINTDGTVHIRVYINQTYRDGSEITVIDEANIIIRKVVEPIYDKGDNAS